MDEMNYKTDCNKLRLAVMGLGHVGLPTALGLAELGWSVVGADDDRVKSRMISDGEVPFHEPGVEDLLKTHLAQGSFVVANDSISAIRGADVVFVCVGTPQDEDGAADISQLDKVSSIIGANLNSYKLVVEKSTSPIQTAAQLEKTITSHSQISGFSFDMAVNPEFLREGTALDDFFNPDRIVLGVSTERARHILLEIYEPLLSRAGRDVESTVLVTDINTAELIKHASNAFLATKISFVNMVSDLCEATGANIDDVVRGMGMDPRIGRRYFEPGIGYGGYCLPKDIRAFSWIADQHEIDFSLLNEVQKINNVRAERFVQKVRDSLGKLNGRTLAIWGIAFKPGTDDIREAPSLNIINKLLLEGAKLRLYDPAAMDEFIAQFDGDSALLTYCNSPGEAGENSEAILLLTEWPEFLKVDLPVLRCRMLTPLIIDGRNLLNSSVVRDAGFEYHSIGRSGF